MPSPLYVFICVKTTADFVVPVSSPTPAEFQRKVKNAFAGLVGGVLRAGDLKFRPNQDAVPNHLLCNGGTITRAQFPQLVDVLAGPDAQSATLPDYTGSVEAAPVTVVQETTTSGTVTTGGTVTDEGQTGGTTGGNVPSGGRVPTDKKQVE